MDKFKVGDVIRNTSGAVASNYLYSLVFKVTKKYYYLEGYFTHGNSGVGREYDKRHLESYCELYSAAMSHQRAPRK